MVRLDAHLVEQGATAEARFRAWLDASRLPHIYTDQSRESVPAHFRSTMKRPDYLVALPYVGTVAFDVKAKTAYGPQTTFVFDVSEVRRLAAFDRLFRITTFFACLALDGSDASVWFPVEDLMYLVGRRRTGAVRVPARDGLAVDMARPFQEALRDTISLS
jgi:hypothetical protein